MKKKFWNPILTHIKKLSHRNRRQCDCSQFLWNRFLLNQFSWSLNFFFHPKKFRLQPKFCHQFPIWIWKKSGLDCSTKVELGIFWKLSGYNSPKCSHNMPLKSLAPKFQSFLAKFTENLEKCEIFCHFTIFRRFITIFHQNGSNSIFLYFVADYEVV